MFKELIENQEVSPEVISAFDLLFEGSNMDIISEDQLKQCSDAVFLISDYKCPKNLRGLFENIYMDIFLRSRNQQFRNTLPSVHGPIGMTNLDNPLDSFPVGW